MRGDTMLEKTGDILSISNQEQLKNTIFNVPARSYGRKPYHAERYSVIEYLKKLFKYKMVNFSVMITKHESPDFLINTPDFKRGLEFTEASTEAFQCATSKQSSMNEFVFLDLSMFKKTEQVTVKQVSRSFDGEGNKKLFIKKGDKLSGQGWKNDEPEIEWSEIIAETIEKKTAILNKPHFNTDYSTELLIYDNTHVSIFVDPSEVLTYLQKAIGLLELKTKYDLQYKCVSVISHNQVLYDITNSGIVLE